MTRASALVRWLEPPCYIRRQAIHRALQASESHGPGAGWGWPPDASLIAATTRARSTDSCSISAVIAGACLRDLTFRFQASIGCLGPTPGGAVPACPRGSDRFPGEADCLWQKNFQRKNSAKPKCGKRAKSRDPFRWLTRVMDSFSGRRLPHPTRHQE